jgi:hypothetical protein
VTAFPPAGPEPGRDFIEWAAAKAAQARDADTYTRTHNARCWAVHPECALAEIARLRRLLADGRAGYGDIHPEDAA